MYELSDKSTEIIGQVLEFLDNDRPGSDINCYLEEEFEAMEKEAKYIGKTDINGKKIYADSSIVEFDYLSEKGSRNCKEPFKRIGVFKYDNLNCCYRIQGQKIDTFKMSRFKIIGTVQENKELLCTMN